VLGTDRISAIAASCGRIFVADALHDYIISLATATRNMSDVRLRASPRGSVSLLRAARAYAAIDGRVFAVPEDVKDLVVSVLAHRLILDPEASLRGTTAEDVIERVLAAVPTPEPDRA
jgi:MoxR-like ATPase